MKNRNRTVACRAGMLLGTFMSGAVAVDQAVAREQPILADDEIVITATKKATAEKPEDVPLAIGTFDQAALVARNVKDLSSLTYALPGVSLDAVGTFRGTANFTIRGLGVNSSIASVDPAVGTFVDGVYLGVNAGAVLDLFDVERIEVLLGPQGTLYGRNTTGGAVLINTANPTRDWQISGRAALEAPVGADRGGPSVTLQSALSGPLARRLAFRIGAHLNRDAGYFRNRFNRTNLGEAKTVIVRGGLSYEAGPLRVLAKAEYLGSQGDGAVGQNHGHFRRDSFDVSLDNEGMIDIESRFGVLRTDYSLGSGTITNITGYRNFSQFTDNDIDATPAFLFHSETGLHQRQYSNELRYAGKFGRFDLTAGGYAFHQRIAYQEDRAFAAGAPQFGGGRQSLQTYALFGESEYAATPHLSIISGLRWTREAKAAAITYVRPHLPCSVLERTCPTEGPNPLFPAELNGFREKRSWHSLAPKIGLSYKPDQSSLLYLNWTRGFRSGGFNVRVTQPVSFEALARANGTHSYDEERVDTAEAGAKLIGLGGKVALSAAAYRSAVSNLQREINAASPTAGLAQSIFNTADARITGGEVQAHLVAGRTKLDLNAGYIHAAYRNIKFDISGDGLINTADERLQLPRVPKWTFGGQVQHTMPLSAGVLAVARAAYQHRDRYAWTDSNFGWVNSSDNVDADLTFRMRNGKVGISLYGRNLLDEVQFGGDTQLGFAGGPLSDGNNRPFDDRPAAGTFSPLVKGRAVGLTITFAN